MTEEDEALSAEVRVGPVVAVKLLASPVAHLTGGEQGRQRGPDSIYSGVLLLSYQAYILCRDQRIRGQTEH